MMNTKYVVYGATGCPWTENSLNWFENHGIKKVTFHDIVKDFNAREELLKKTGQLTYPVIEINGEIVMGFDRQKIEQLYANG